MARFSVGNWVMDASLRTPRKISVTWLLVNTCVLRERYISVLLTVDNEPTYR